MGKLSRTKGHSFERWVAQQLRGVFPKAERQLEYQINQCQGVDLKNTGNFNIQCKRLKSYASVNKIFEIKPSEKIPLLITKADRQPVMCVLPFEYFIRILEDIGEAYESSERS